MQYFSTFFEIRITSYNVCYTKLLRCRVSSHLPEQLDSLVNQISGLTRTVATTPGWTLVDTYIDIKSGSHST